MPAYDPDPRLERDGKSLREWLLLLATRDVPVTDPQVVQASRSLSAMRSGMRAIMTDDEVVAQYADTLPDTPDLASFDFEAHAKKFDDAYQAQLADPSFPLRDYFERVVRHIVTGQRAYSDWVAADMKAMDALPLDEALEYEPDEAGQHAAMMQGMTAAHLHQLIERAGPALLGAPASIHALLTSSDARLVDTALTAIGPKAVAWADAYLTELERCDSDATQGILHRVPHVLGAIAQGHAPTIERLIALVRGGNQGKWSEHRASAAASALGLLAPLAPFHVDAVWPALDALCTRLAHPNFAEPGWRWVNFLPQAWFSIGRDKPLVQERLFAALAQREDHEARGRAMDGLEYVPALHAQAAPHLADALATFEEWNPDLAEHDPHRIAAALRTIGPHAIGALPAMLTRIERGLIIEPDMGFCPPWSLLEVLRTLGPAARAATPLLERWRTLAHQQEEGEVEPNKLRRLEATLAAIA